MIILRISITISNNIFFNYGAKMKRCIQILLATFILTAGFSQSYASLKVLSVSIQDTLKNVSQTSKKLYFTNIGPTSRLDYTITTDQRWLKVSSNNGSISKGDTAVIDLVYITEDLNSGDNIGNLTIGDPHHGPIVVPVHAHVLSITGAEEDLLNHNIVVYPNPSVNFASFEVNIAKADEVTISIFDNLGRLAAEPVKNVYVSKTASFNWHHGLPSGSYRAVIKTGNIQTTKLINVIK